MPIILAGEEGCGLFYVSRNFAFEVIVALPCHRLALFREMRSEKAEANRYTSTTCCMLSCARRCWALMLKCGTLGVRAYLPDTKMLRL